MADITVITATLPERAHLLEEAKASMAAQTVQPEWLIGIDHERRGPVAVRNALAQRALTEWLFCFDDDDLLDPQHFQVLLSECDARFDIVHTWCRIEHGGSEHPVDQFQLRPKSEAGWQFLRERNWIPISAAIRASLFRELGGFRDVEREDHDLWIRALDVGARFHCIPQVTWTYRLGPWQHRSAA